MTRPAGTTPRGLPYPGSGNTHADTPRALQSLAEAISGQLSSIGGGIVFDYWVGVKTLDGSASATIVFPNLAACQGMLLNFGTWAGGPLRPGSPVCSATGQFWINAANNAIYGVAESFANTPVTVCAIGWGPPKPN